MNISCFWRLLLSHLAILLLSTVACLYSIVELGSLSGRARKALDGNQRMIAYQEALTDAFLSQVRYGGKFLITHTEGRQEQLYQFKKDFLDYLGLLKFLGESEPIKTSLLRIERLHRQYHDLFEREAGYIRARQNYAQSRYEQERDKIVESSIRELDGLKAQLRADLHQRLEQVEQGARTARRIAVAATLLVLFLGTLLSLKISRSLTEPRPRTATHGAGGPSSEPQSRIDALVQAFKVRRARVVEQLQAWVRRQSKGFTAGGLSLLAAWNRRSIIWKNPSTRKGN
jgi:hypothetical protein